LEISFLRVDLIIDILTKTFKGWRVSMEIYR